VIRSSSAEWGELREADEGGVMTFATMLPLAMLIAQAEARFRAWQGMRLIGLLTVILLVLAIIYLVKRIMAK
jgi:flagellar biogenesis protein FliO